MGHSEIKNLRIWHLLSNRWNSAITEYMISTVRSLQLLGVENIVTPPIASPAELRLIAAGIPVKGVYSFSPFSLLTFNRLAREIKPDLVFTYGGPETIVSMGLAAMYSAKYWRFRGQPSDRNSSFSRVLQDVSHNHVGQMIVPSMAVFNKQSSGNQKKSQVIALGVDAGKYQRDCALGPTDRPELLIFGRLDPVKGHAQFFKIFKNMLDKWEIDSPRPLLKIVGREENTKVADLEKIRRELGIDSEDVIYISEHIQNTAAVMTAATLGIIPSLGSEFICRVAHEFLLCGTPILVSGVGGLNEVSLENSVHSYQGLDNDCAAIKLHEVLQRSYLEPEAVRLRRSLEAKDMYSLEAMAKQYQQLLYDIL